jgi:pyruvate dehydrogenase E2 component (dihydrolipoamide acetyltransferase)
LATASEVKVTVTDLLLAIFASVLKATPDLCAVWENGAPRARNSVDIGLVVASEFGSVAPVIKDVASLDLLQLLAIRHHLVERGREGKLSLTETEGGIATLNNLGMYRIDRCQSVITPGQSSVLTMGSIRIRPWVEAALVVKPTVILNLTVDHRVADGDAAATFLNKLIELIENPARLNLRTGLTSQAVASGRTNV